MEFTTAMPPAAAVPLRRTEGSGQKNEPHHALRRLAKAKAGSAPKLKRVQELRAQAVREDHLTPAGLARPGHLVRKIING